MDLVEIGRISSKHVRVTVASPKGAQIPRSVGATPPITGTLSTTAMNNHVSTTTDEVTKNVLSKEERVILTENVEEMDTREGKSHGFSVLLTDERICSSGSSRLILIFICSSTHSADCSFVILFCRW